MTLLRNRRMPLLGLSAIIAVGLLAVGVAGLGGPSPRPAVSPGTTVPGLPPDPVAWRAVDWRRLAAPFPAPIEPGHDRIDGMVRGGPGILGWGRLEQQGRNQFNDVGAIYLSVTGEAWQVVPLVAGVGQPDTSEPRHVVEGPAGIVVVGGVCCEVEGPAIWRSVDGLAWQAVAAPAAFAELAAADLIATDDGYILGGTTPGGSAIWTSTDGADWEQVDGAAAGFGPGGLNDLVAMPDGGYLAVGWTDDGQTYDGAAWHSADGREWEPFDLGPLFSGPLDTVLYRVMPWAGGWWMAGNQGPHEERVQCENLLGIARADPATILPTLSCGWGREMHWLSLDARSWQPVRMPWHDPKVPPAAGTLIEFRLVEAGGPGLVAVGEGADDGRPSLFASVDGRTWEKVPTDDLFPVSTVANAMALDGRRIVVTTDGPTIWIGTIH